jgi:hypothetical protein
VGIRRVCHGGCAAVVSTGGSRYADAADTCRLERRTEAVRERVAADDSRDGNAITPVWPIAPANLKLDEAALRAKVAEAAKQTEPHSTEGALALHDLKTPGGRGFYYAATDRAPKPGEYKYLTQGMIPVGAIALAFTVVSNDQDGKTARAALDMLKSAALRRVPN